MKNLPQILILGRANVGKSTLINRILNKHLAITLDQPGITRDIGFFPTTFNGKDFALLDSGGLFLEDQENQELQTKVEQLVLKQAEKVQKIVFLADYQSGLHPLDKKIAQFLRPLAEKVVVAVNKIDNLQSSYDLGDYFRLGFSQIFPVSALHGTGLTELLNTVTKDLVQKESIAELHENSYKISIIGRPNVGKSSLINAILNEERVLVDNKAGTTRDSIEVYFENQGQKYFFVDTAGIRKKAKIKDGVEYYSVLRATKAMREADLTIFMTDTEDFFCDQDKKILDNAIKEHINLIVFVNKWDLTERTDQIRANFQNVAKSVLPNMEYCPFIFGSAKEKVNIGKLFNLIPEVIKSSQQRIPTSQLNEFIERVIKKNPPSAKYGKNIKIYYATQPEIFPPAFVFFINHPELLDDSYKRFVEKRMRTHLKPFEGVFFKLLFKHHRTQEQNKPK